MSILNTVESMAAGHSFRELEEVGNALIDELEQNSGGISALMREFQRNGMGAYVERWEQGDTQPNPTAIEGGLRDTGLVDRIAQRSHLSHGVVRGSLALIVPLLIHHVVANDQLSTTGEVRGVQLEPRAILQSVLASIR